MVEAADGVAERGSLRSLPSTCSWNRRALWPTSSYSPRSQLCMGGQVHSTRVFVWSQLLLVCLSVALFVSVASGYLADKQLSLFTMTDRMPTRSRFNGTDEVHNSNAKIASSAKVREALKEEGRLTASLALAVAYLYLISVPLSWLGVHSSEMIGGRAGSPGASCPSRCSRILSAVLLTPWLFSVFTLSIPLLIFTVRLIADSCYYSPEGGTFIYIIYEIWYKYFPLVGIWCVFLYVLYCCALAFVFAWRRANGKWTGGTLSHRRCHRELAAVSNFSWALRSARGRLRSTQDDLNKSLGSIGGQSSRSWKSTRNPTLRGYEKKTDDLDVSLLSDDADYIIDRSFTSHKRLTPSDQMRASRGFSCFSGAGTSRVVLEPVEEEETQETMEKASDESSNLHM